MRFLFLVLGFVLACSLPTRAEAQFPTLTLGAILPLTGSDSDLGRVQERALQAALDPIRARGLGLELHLVDSRSLPSESATGAEALIDMGVHALICCSSEAEARAILPLVAKTGIPLLSLSAFDAGHGDTYWAFSLAPSEAATLEHIALEPDLQPTFLMAPVSGTGDLAARMLGSRAGTVRYPPGRTPLTPEALWAITRTPASIVVWDDARGTLEAARALVARGYGSDLIVSAAVWRDLDALGRASLTGTKSVLSPAALGYTLADGHPSKASVATFRRALIGLPNSFLTEAALSQGAAAWDAVFLLANAAEQIFVYDPAITEEKSVAAFRQSLRDALLGLGPQNGAGGTYDFSEGQQRGPLASSLILGTWRGGSFRPQ